MAELCRQEGIPRALICSITIAYLVSPPRGLRPYVSHLARHSSVYHLVGPSPRTHVLGSTTSLDSLGAHHICCLHHLYTQYPSVVPIMLQAYDKRRNATSRARCGQTTGSLAEWRWLGPVGPCLGEAALALTSNCHLHALPGHYFETISTTWNPDPLLAARRRCVAVCCCWSATRRISVREELLFTFERVGKTRRLRASLQQSLSRSPRLLIIGLYARGNAA